MFRESSVSPNGTEAALPAAAERTTLDFARAQVSADRSALLVRPAAPGSEETNSPVAIAGAGASPSVQRLRSFMDRLGEEGPRSAAAVGAVMNGAFQIEMTQAHYGADQASLEFQQASAAVTTRNSVEADTERMLAMVEGELARRQRDGVESDAGDAKYRAIRNTNTRAGTLAVANAIFIQNVQGQLPERLDAVAFAGKLGAGNSPATADRGWEMAHFFDRGGTFSTGVIRQVQGLRDDASRVGETFNHSSLLTSEARARGQAILAREL